MLTPKDLERLKGVHPDLVRVIKRADTLGAKFKVIEGLRSLDRQRQLKAKGASQTMNSRHLTGHAVDIAPLENGEVSWAWPLYYPLAKIVKEAAKIEQVPVEWGGDWKKFKDGPHWQLPWAKYPADAPPEAAAEPKMQKESPVNKETVSWAAGIAASLGAVFTGHGPVQYALGAVIVIGFAVGVWLWWRGSR